MTRRCDRCGAKVADATGSRQCSLLDVPADPRATDAARSELRSGRILCPACQRTPELFRTSQRTDGEPDGGPKDEVTAEILEDLDNDAEDLPGEAQVDAALDVDAVADLDDEPDQPRDGRHPLDTLPDAPPGYVSRQIAGETIGMEWRHGSHVYVRPPSGPVDHDAPWVNGFRDSAIACKPYQPRRGRNAEAYRHGYNDGKAWRIGTRIGECFRDASTAGDLRGSVARVQLLDVLGGQAHERKDDDRASMLWRLAEDLDQGR